MNEKKKQQRTLYTFVGERRSETAIRKGWHWQDGRLAAAPLFEALRAMGIEPSEQSFVNLFEDSPGAELRGWLVDALREVAGSRVIVALGQRVSRALAKAGIEHVAMVHPAARGRIRKRRRYVAHVRSKLQPKRAA